MNDSPLPSALRELRSHLGHRTTQIALIGAGLLLGLSGPFETITRMPLVPRLIYWLFVVASTYALGNFTDNLCRAALASRPKWQQLTASTIATGLGVSLLLLVINFASFGRTFPPLAEFATSIAIVTAISGVIIIGASLAQPAMAPTRTPALLARLPLDKRGALISLSVTDHYVDVTTTNGTELLLMRLSDAINETTPTDGLQIHRSHWVATDHIASVERTGDRAIVTLENGTKLPVSRSNIPLIRNAGLLPR